MTESTFPHQALDARRAALPIPRRVARTLRATAVAAVLTVAGAAENGALVAATVWLLATGSGRAASPGLLLDIAATVGALLFIPIGLIVGISVRSWLEAEDRLAE